MRELLIGLVTVIGTSELAGVTTHQIQPDEVHLAIVDLAQGQHAIVAHEMASDIELTVWADPTNRFSIDSPKGGASHEVAIVDLTEATALSIEISRLDHHGDGRFSLSVTTPPTNAHRALSKAATTYSRLALNSRWLDIANRRGCSRVLRQNSALDR